MNNMYSRSLQVVLRHRIWTLPVIVLMLGAIVDLWGAIPSEMAPLEDRSMITINTRGAEGVTYEYIRDYTEDINSIVDSVIPDADAVTARVSSGSGNIQIRLKDMGDRDYTQMEAAEKLSQAVKRKPKRVHSYSNNPHSAGVARACLYNMFCKRLTSRSWKKVLPVFMEKSLRESCVPNGRCRPEIQQAGNSESTSTATKPTSWESTPVICLKPCNTD